MPLPRLAPLTIVLALATSACASTVIETSDSVPPTSATVVETTVAPTLESALAEILSISSGLGDLIVEGGSPDDDALARILSLWDAAGAEMNDIDPPLFREVEHQLELLQTAVGRKRPADADKASRSLRVVIDAFTERHGG